MSALPKPDNATQLARDNLLKIHARCQEDRHAYFPETAGELINNTAELRVIVFSTRGLGFCQQLDQIEAAVRLKGGRIEALVHDVDDKDNLQNPHIAGYTQLTADTFFANPEVYKGCLIVDRTCTWYPGIRYKVRLKQAGFTVLRVEQFLNAPGLEAAGGSYRLHADVMLERFDEFLALERHWIDDLSLQTYYYTLAAFISMNHQYFAFHCGDYRQRYFSPDIDLKFNAQTVYADCGSHDGQEVLIFAERVKHQFKAVHAFEPDHTNFINLSNNIANYTARHGAKPIYCHELGVFDRNAYLYAEGYDSGVTITDQASSSGFGLHVCRLDDMLDELTHLRLEIEGAELEALHGANQLILKNRPTLTVSAYHKATDFPDLLKYIEETGLDYQLSLRHQSLEPGVLCIYGV
ncbi:FkbM family methyltransferase [Methylovorus sp. MP688]|uniref:FkbM family methyltransferase n=1 Tax=Methylovorus sp. (strain MP688) TaxID=887061 RepID=UPI0001EC4CC6|nr:FkbM family methyltransferase [Methylovorus sp. MP688]ADQ85873.1 methyltransferase FkbM family [Methylovorus sp. MP688]